MFWVSTLASYVILKQFVTLVILKLAFFRHVDSKTYITNSVQFELPRLHGISACLSVICIFKCKNWCWMYGINNCYYVLQCENGVTFDYIPTSGCGFSTYFYLYVAVEGSHL